MKENVVFKAYVTNLGMYNEGILCGEWVDFPIEVDPVCDDNLNEAVNDILCRIRVDGIYYDEYFITDYDCDIKGLTDSFGEYENIFLLNFLAKKIQDMDYSIEQLEAMIALGEYTKSVEELINLVDNPDSFYFMPDVENDYDLGYKYATETALSSEQEEVMGALIKYIDYESYGRDIRLLEGGIHTDNGYISRTDDIKITFDAKTDKIPDDL